MCPNKVLPMLGLAALTVLSLTPGAGCNPLDFAHLATVTSTSTEEFETTSSPKIIVETFNGSVDVSPSDTDRVVVEVTKRAGGFDQQSAEANLDLIEVSMIQKDNTLHVTARRVGAQPIHAGVDVVISAPVASQLKLHSSNGHVVCEGLQGGIDAVTANGKVEIVAGQGQLDLKTSNGPIAVEATNAIVNAHTSNGRIRFRGTLAGGEQELSTSNGRIQCEFPLDQKGPSRRGRLQGVVGDDPACSINASTSNGTIQLQKRSID
jgi:DUF4097 and DUF4098 domain-containing protein YvlB